MLLQEMHGCLTLVSRVWPAHGDDEFWFGNFCIFVSGAINDV